MAFDEIIRNLRGCSKSLQSEAKLPVSTVRTVSMDWERCPRGSYTCVFNFDNPQQEIPPFLFETCQVVIENGNPPLLFSCDENNVTVRVGNPEWGPTGLELECAKNISDIYNDMRHTYTLAHTEDASGH